MKTRRSRGVEKQEEAVSDRLNPTLVHLLPVKKLKDELAARNLPTNGGKDVLIQRLEDALALEKLITSSASETQDQTSSSTSSHTESGIPATADESRDTPEPIGALIIDETAEAEGDKSTVAAKTKKRRTRSSKQSSKPSVTESDVLLTEDNADKTTETITPEKSKARKRKASKSDETIESKTPPSPPRPRRSTRQTVAEKQTASSDQSPDVIMDANAGDSAAVLTQQVDTPSTSEMAMDQSEIITPTDSPAPTTRSSRSKRPVQTAIDQAERAVDASDAATQERSKTETASKESSEPVENMVVDDDGQLAATAAEECNALLSPENVRNKYRLLRMREATGGLPQEAVTKENKDSAASCESTANQSSSAHTTNKQSTDSLPVEIETNEKATKSKTGMSQFQILDFSNAFISMNFLL